MFISTGTLEPLALRKSAATVGMKQGGCDLHVPYTGTLTPQAQATLTSALRRLMVQMRYGTRLKGLSVSAEEQVLTVTPVASNYAIQQWLDSGELMAAVDLALRQARGSATR
ncbi:MAG: hypothetical protein JHD16_01740 [Solirubrobacteraceae bacterium]|nr:hypothetical protein [Solirubrobacteraceae bacterium]